MSPHVAEIGTQDAKLPVTLEDAELGDRDMKPSTQDAELGDPDTVLGTQGAELVPATRWRRMRQRFGLLQPALLIGSSAGILLVIGALISIWTWSKQDDPNQIRSRVMYHDWVKSVIAVCCAILRTCMAVQLGTCCLMMATLAFEKNCVLLCDAAKMSIHRYASTSPWSLAPPVLRGAKVSKNYSIIILVVLLSLAMVLSQGLSAILLIDLDNDFVRGPKITTSRRFFEGPPFVSVQPLRIRPGSLARFGESRIENSFLSLADAEGRRLNDTVATFRGFPQLRNEVERENLVYFNGRGAVVEGHVLCVSPDIDELIYDEPDRITGKLSSQFMYDSARKVDTSGSFMWNGAQPSSDLVFDFNCTLGGFQGFMLCPLKSPKFNDCPGFPTPCLLSARTAWFLIIDEDTSLLWKQDEFEDHRRPPSLELAQKLYNKTAFQANGHGWMSSTAYGDAGDNTGARNYTTQMSLCTVASGHSLATIELASAWRADEPVLGSPHANNNSYTAALRSQLSDGLDLASRGVMNLTNYTIEEYRDFTPVVHHIRGGANDYLLYINRSNASAMSGYTQSIMLVEELDEVYWVLFQETWANSSVAWALHSMFGTLISQAYYDQLNIPEGLYEEASTNTTKVRQTPRTVQSTKAVQVPTQNMGLFIACGVVGVHLVSVAIVFWLYFTCKAEKFLDQAWQTIGQLHHGEATEFLGETGNKGDLEVRRLPTAEPHWKRIVEIRNSGLAFKAAKGSSAADGIKSEDRDKNVGRTSTITIAASAHPPASGSATSRGAPEKGK
ncbi:hypothetical protein FPV67DRAFT_1683767 [Lyophyllum atratum]|nr:hypothetical protein FPV67DRAFT_1683767 [Lyophyllum atratum]